MSTCDIIIPTYNNGTTLLLALESITSQAAPQGWKVNVLIADDGSTDGTEALLSDFIKSGRVTLIPGNHGGIAAARNRCLEQSHADVVLFLGADIILRPNALRDHLQFHQDNPSLTQAAVGMIVWDPRINPTPLMEWMVHGQWQQNNMNPLLSSTSVSVEDYFYGSHVSCKRQQIDSLRFSDKLNGYGYEDIHFGWQLSKKNTVLHVLHSAMGLHHHKYQAKDFFRRQFMIGKSMVTYNKLRGLAPPQESIKIIHKIQYYVYPPLGIRFILRALVSLLSTRWTVPKIYAHSSGYEMRRGILRNN